MPNGDTVQIQMPDGRILTGPKSGLPTALKMGAKLYDPTKATPPDKSIGQSIKDFGSELGRQLNPISAVKGAAQLTAHPISSYEQDAAARQKILDMAKQSLKNKDYAGAAAHGLYSMIPFMGTELERSGEQFQHGEVAKGLGSSTGMGIAASTPALVEGAGELAKPLVKGTAREFMGVADKDVQPIVEKSKSDIAKAEAKHAEKVESIKSQTAEKIADVQAKKMEASKTTTAAETKQAALVTKKGPVYQRLTEMADNAQSNVQAVDEKVRALEGAKWSAFERKIDHPTVDWEPVQQAVVEAEDTILKGSPENITLFRNIMKEGDGPGGLSNASVFRSGAGVDVKEFLSSIKDPAKRQQFISEMQARGEDIGGGGPIPKEGATVPFDTARGFATEFDRKIYGADLPGDVRRALRYVQDANNQQLVKAIGKAGGKDAVLEYKQLKSNWRDYMQAFYDKDSPVRKLKEGKDPNDKLTPITGDEGERAISLLGKYRSLGADVQGLGKIRALHKSIRELPSGKGKMPSDVEKPSFPDAPTQKALTLEQARKAKLEKAAQTYSHPPSRWELMFPPLHGYRLVLKNLLQSKGFRDWLSSDGPAVPSK
jgi:hypothetical protein